MAAKSDHSRALPDGSASTRSTCCPASAKTCANQTADVVLPVPGLRLSSATLSGCTITVWQLGEAASAEGMQCSNAAMQYPRHYASRPQVAGMLAWAHLGGN